MAVAGVYIGDAAITICIADYARDADAIPRLTKPQFINVHRSRGFKGAMNDLVEALKEHSNLQAIYVGTFGPLVSIDPKMRGKKGSDYGRLQRINTHMQDWQGEHLYDTLVHELERDDIWIDVDVHVAARGEILYQFDSEYARYCEDAGEAALSPREYLAGQAYAFVEISNGLGCGISQGLSPWRGRLHPEFGHSICRHAAEDKLPSDCYLHPSCLEGRASLRAFKSRLKAAGHELSQVLNDPKSNELEAVKDAFRMQAAYIGQLCVNATTAYSPAKIVIGDDLGRSSLFLHYTRSFFHQYMGGSRERYFPSYPDLMDLQRYIAGASQIHPGKRLHIGAFGAALSAGLAKEAV